LGILEQYDLAMRLLHIFASALDSGQNEQLEIDYRVK
jgi:hypothetical protein